MFIALYSNRGEPVASQRLYCVLSRTTHLVCVCMCVGVHTHSTYVVLVQVCAEVWNGSFCSCATRWNTGVRCQARERCFPACKFHNFSATQFFLRRLSTKAPFNCQENLKMVHLISTKYCFSIIFSIFFFQSE